MAVGVILLLLRDTASGQSAASDVYKRQEVLAPYTVVTASHLVQALEAKPV